MHPHRIHTRALAAATMLTLTAAAWALWPEPATSPSPAVVEQPVHSPINIPLARTIQPGIDHTRITTITTD